MKTRNKLAKSPKASCGSSGCFISVRVLPYGSRKRRRSTINKRVKA